MTYKKLTLSDFANMEVVSNGEESELIFGYVDGRPVRLLGFSSRERNRFLVQEAGYWYFRDLLEHYGKPGANLY